MSTAGTESGGAPHPRGERLQRILADAGVASRRACEELITAGRVSVNGRVVSTLPAFVDPEHDRIAVDGRPIRTGAGGRFGGAGRGIYLMLNKPSRTVTTARDEYGRATVLDLVTHPAKARLFPVGRLDFETTGLLLLTNDGELAHRLTHARWGITRTFQVEVKGAVTEAALRSIERDAAKAARRAAKATAGPARPRRGDGPAKPHAPGKVELAIAPMARPGGGGGGGGGRAAGARVSGGNRSLLEVTLAEGRNRELGGVLRRAGLPIKKVTSVGLGPLRLSKLAVGMWRELDRREIRALKRAVGMVEGGRAKAGPGRPKGKPSGRPGGGEGGGGGAEPLVGKETES